MPKEIIVYSTPTCPACQQVKEYLKSNGISYQDYDVASDSEARQEMAEKTGSMSVPTLLIDGQTVIGFNRKQLEELLH